MFYKLYETNYLRFLEHLRFFKMVSKTEIECSNTFYR